ncbi:8076_t:CDS:2 [Ambispora leptoticha]|uniref:8076_t:CDS:1 n=1 Tax=Ambispora leptoticha TaxID=144679 RepID=A0A9N8WCB6_9GLOM|nr:8076_t:CDS:2 [Ambispora leptoticha]
MVCFSCSKTKAMSNLSEDHPVLVTIENNEEAIKPPNILFQAQFDYVIQCNFKRFAIDVTTNNALKAQTANLNSYYLSPVQNNYIGFQRYKNESLVPGARNILGTPPPEVDDAYYIQTTFQTGNAPIDNLPYYMYLNIRLLTHEVPILKQQRNRMFLGVVSDVGGAYTFFVGVLLLLLGQRPINPWGTFTCQKICPCVKNKVQSKLVEKYDKIFREKNGRDANPSVELTMVELDNRLKQMEKFLSKYVINVDYLGDARKNHTSDPQRNAPSQ